MKDRKYSVEEIDKLRTVVGNKVKWGAYSWDKVTVPFWSGNEEEVRREVEDRVRTFMLAGLTAEDLEASE